MFAKRFAKSFSKYLLNRTNYSYCNLLRARSTDFKDKILRGPSLSDFIQSNEIQEKNERYLGSEKHPYIAKEPFENLGRKVYIETYGCQMNVSDTEIINAILEKDGFTITKEINDCDAIFIVTCAIREGAEQKIWRRLQTLKAMKKQRHKSSPLQIGLLGCMAERLKHKVLEKEKLVDIVAGPDSYRHLPNLLSLANKGQKAVNVMLSTDETYADIMPVRTNLDAKTAFISIMRGCENMCTYCIVPFTRGKERSRPVSSILDEIRYLSDQGYKEVTLLGQNVNSYRDLSGLDYTSVVVKRPNDEISKGFSTVYRQRIGGQCFSDLLEKAADINPEMRIRFTSPHPKDFPDPVLHVINSKPNICNLIHLPAQSGSSQVLSLMERGHTRESYLELVNRIRCIIPDVAFTSDFICGFCGETEKDHQDTLSLIEQVKYEFVYVFAYSMRNKTAAFYDLKDDVPEEVKKHRADEAHEVFRKWALELHKKEIGKEHLVLVNGASKRSELDWAGRNDWNTKVIFPHQEIPISPGSKELRLPQNGDYIVTKIIDCSSQVLKGESLYHTTLQEFVFQRRHRESKTNQQMFL